MIRLMDFGEEHCDYIKAAKIRYTFHTVEDMWNDLTAMFTDKWVRYIPVFNEDGKLLCLSYMKYWERDAYIAGLDKILRNQRGKAFSDFLKKYWKNTEIQIIGFNENAWKLYKFFKENHILVRGVGKKWEQFYPDAISGDVGKNIHHVWKIDVEGKNSENPADNLLFMWMEPAYNTVVVQEWRQYLERHGILFQCIPIPQREDLQFITPNEQYRWENKIAPYMNKAKWEDEETRKHMPQKNEQGERLCWDEWQKIDEKKQKSEVEINGERIGYQEYGTGKRNVYLIGPCIVRGMCVSDEDTLGSYIYRAFRRTMSDVKVICLSPERGTLVLVEDLVQRLLLRTGDIVIYFSGNVHPEIEGMGYGYKRDVDLWPLFNARKTDYFWDCPIHTNEIGNKYVGERCVEEITKNHKRYIDENNLKYHVIQAGKVLLAPKLEEALERYIEEIKKTKGCSDDRRKGAVVMNCNPMTNGHLYLIRQALQTVDFLYVFVVEEDKSEIVFKDRIEMVRRAVQNLKNVAVFPSGKFMISYVTMPIYFEKERRQEETYDASVDLQIFCERIAPKLGITVRFMGEEPKDKITRQYNELLSEMAPLYGIQFVEIPRLEVDGEVVSATDVRRYLKEGEFGLVKKVTPKENWEILKNYVGKEAEA